MANIRQLRFERDDIKASMKSSLDKVNRGERLSSQEQRALADASDKLTAVKDELDDAVEARHLSIEGAGPMSTAGSFGAPVVDDSDEARAFSAYIRSGVRGPELRAAGEGTGSAGGFLVPPGWWQRLQVALKAYGGTSNFFTPLETDTGQPMQWATNDPTTTVGTLVSENTQVGTVDYTFGQGTFAAYLYSSGVQLVSHQLAQDSAFDIDAYITARVGESLGRAQAAAAISGTGSAQPLGVITALNAASGLTSGGKYALTAGNKVNILANGTAITSATTQVTELTAGTLNPTSFVAVVKSVDPAYRALGARWFMNDVTLQNTRLISDGYGRPYYPEIQDDTDPTLYGYPVTVDNNIPSLTASTASGILFGHAQSAMTLRSVAGAGILRLDQRYADFLQIGYIGYKRFDIRSNDLRAMTVVVPAAT